MVEIIRSFDIPILVDEAHGAFFHFHDQSPMSAMRAGVGIAATSIYKLEGALTQSSILNIKGNRVALREWLPLMKTASNRELYA